MKLSRLYSNKPSIFETIDFVSGLNVVIAEIRLPENKMKDIHNLGKTTLGRMIDFCLLSTGDKGFFLFKHEDRFKEFIFFIEIELLDNTFLTIKRSVAEATKISFKKHLAGGQDYAELSDGSWDHVAVPFERAKALLDNLLDLRAIKPWPFRKELGYLLRSQPDYGDVFQLKKFAYAHSDWKPFLAHILGFNSQLIKDYYSKEDVLLKDKEAAQTIEKELVGASTNLSKVEGILLLKQKDAEKKQKLLDSFDFRLQDKEKTKQLVDVIDEEIAGLNSRRYYLLQNKKKIASAFEEEQILFNPSAAERLFKETGILFQGQIKRDFEQLIAFNKAITTERRAYLAEELGEIDKELKEISAQLNNFGKQRSQILSFLSETDPFLKYKELTDDLVTLRADILSLERQRNYILRLHELRKGIRNLEDEKEQIRTLIDEDIKKQNSDSNSLFSTIRLFFSEIIEDVIGRQALLIIEPNKEGHLEFKAEILDEAGNTTSADEGTTYKKLLCIAFDMAILRAHISDKFPHFVFHDGVFESLESRKKDNLLQVIRKYCDIGIQQIITLIDSDSPPPRLPEEAVFDDSEIVLRLHDGDESGRLFKMPSW